MLLKQELKSTFNDNKLVAGAIISSARLLERLNPKLLLSSYPALLITIPFLSARSIKLLLRYE